MEPASVRQSQPKPGLSKLVRSLSDLSTKRGVVKRGAGGAALRHLGFYTGHGQAPPKTPAPSTSKFKGVTQHKRWLSSRLSSHGLPLAVINMHGCRTRRWEAHLWVEGKQLYLVQANCSSRCVCCPAGG